MPSRLTQTPKPFQIGPTQSSFPIHIRTKKRRTEWLQFSHNIFSAMFDRAPPTLCGYLAFSCVQRDYDPGTLNLLYQPFEKRQIHFSITEHGAPDDDLFRLPPNNLFR